MNLCLGTVQFGLDYGISNSNGRPNYDRAKQIVEFAYQKGIRYFDTANSYGNSEEMLGKIFKSLGINNQVKVISKLPAIFEIDEIEKHIDNSLKLLGLNQLHGLLLHRPIERHLYEQLEQKVVELKRNDIINHFGASIYTLDEALEWLKYDFIDYLQIPCNVLSFDFMKSDFFLMAKEKNKKVFIRSILLQGLLTMTPSQLNQKGMDWAKNELDFLHNFVKSKQLSLKEFALQFPSTLGNEIIPIIGINTRSELIETLELITKKSVPNLTYEEWWSKDLKVSNRLTNPSLW